MRLKDFPVGDTFKSLEETGGFTYRKGSRTDEFNYILCADLDGVWKGESHWHSPYEEVIDERTADSG